MIFLLPKKNTISYIGIGNNNESIFFSCSVAVWYTLNKKCITSAIKYYMSKSRQTSDDLNYSKKEYLFTNVINTVGYDTSIE